MGLLLHQLLLLASLAALSAGGWRLASAAVPSGLLRALATVALAAGAAELSALALALVGLGGSPFALTVAAAALGVVAWRSLPSQVPSAAAQLRAWWCGLPIAGRVRRAAVAGAAIGYGTWVLRYPGLGLDALTYHLALPVAWAHNGRPGSLVVVNDGLALQNYPLTWEVLVAWFTAIARTLVPATLLTPATLVLLGTSVRAGLGELRASARLSWLAAAALVTLPIVVIQLPGPNNDLPEAAWLACAAALIAGAAARRAEGGARLLAPALIAVGLCVGTKTTGALLAALCLVLGGWACRRGLRRVAVPLAVAAVAAALIGGVWYVRNLIDHGAPFWPLSTTPWGDPVPPAFRAVDHSLLSNFHATVHARTDAYWRVLAGGVVLVLGAVISPLWATARRVALAGAVVVVATLLVWAASPYTGISRNVELAVGATRYLLPCLLAAAVVVALAGGGAGAGARGGGDDARGSSDRGEKRVILARKSPRRSHPFAGSVRAGLAEALSAAVLLGALGVNLDRDVALGFPNAPSARLLLVAAAIGGAVALGISLALRARGARGARGARAARGAGPLGAWLRRRGAPLLAAAAGVVALVTLLLPADGYLRAHARTGLFDAGLVRWLDSRAAFRAGGAPVFVGPISVAVLTGARLAHPLNVLSADERCATLASEARRGWVVLEINPTDLVYDRRWILCLPGRRPAYLDTNFLVYAPRALTAAAS